MRQTVQNTIPENFKLQIYNVWNAGPLTNKIKHPGNIPQEFIDFLNFIEKEN